MLYIFCAHEQNCYLIRNIKRRTVCRFCAMTRYTLMDFEKCRHTATHNLKPQWKRKCRWSFWEDFTDSSLL